MTLFISFEGGEGCGKTTQSKLLAEFLTKNNLPNILTRAPGGVLEAELIRKVIFDENGANWCPMTELLLQNAARFEQTVKVIQPAINENKIVITDRYLDSTIVYQGMVQNLGVDIVTKLHTMILGDFLPKITFLLDIEPSMGLTRAQARSDNNRYDNMDLEFHNKIRASFLEVALLHHSRIIVLDGGLPKEILHDKIVKHVNNLLRLF